MGNITLPPGYCYKTHAHGDSEGIIITVSLVKSPQKAGGLLDRAAGSLLTRLLGKKVLTFAGETSLEATTAEMDALIVKLKQQLRERYSLNLQNG